MRTVLRVLTGFIVACLAGALTTLLFVHTPEELVGWMASLPADERSERFGIFGLLWLAAATQSAIFSAFFVFVAVVIAEWRKVRAWTYYAIGGIIIAVLGFCAQWMAEPTGQNWSVVNSNYPFIAFLTTGFVAGFVYWMVAGRHAGGIRMQAPSSPSEVGGKEAMKGPASTGEASSASGDKPAVDASAEAVSKA